MWTKSAGRSNTWGIDRDTSYISLSPSAAGGGGAGGSAATFQELTDTPATMAFGSGKYLKVNDQGTAIEFVDLPGGGGGGGGGGSAPPPSSLPGKIPFLTKLSMRSISWS